MTDLSRTEEHGGLYGRLLQRLALALEEADAAGQRGTQLSAELELKGLSPAELQLVRAYLEQDLSWLKGWHAAAEQFALLKQQSVSASSARGAKPAGSSPVRLKRRQLLCCAVCGTPVSWLHAEDIQACHSCGSQLFRSGAAPR